MWGTRVCGWFGTRHHLLLDFVVIQLRFCNQPSLQVQLSRAEETVISDGCGVIDFSFAEGLHDQKEVVLNGLVAGGIDEVERRAAGLRR